MTLQDKIYALVKLGDYIQRNDERRIRRTLGGVIQEQRQCETGHGLPEKLGHGTDTTRVFIDNFLVVIDPANRPEGRGGEQHC